MECSRFKELFSDHIDGTLDEQTRRMLEGHLAVCEHCAEELRELRACVSALGSLEKVQAPADFLHRVHERIHRGEPVSWRQWLKEKLCFPVRVKLPLGAAGLVMTALLVMVVYQGTRQRTGPVPVPVPAQVPEPSAMKPQEQLESRLDDRQQLALRESPAPPLSETAAGSGAPGSPPALARESRPMRLTLVIGHDERRGRAFAQKERPGSEDDKPAEVPRGTSTVAPERKTLAPPAASQSAPPASPSTSGKGMISSRSKAAETPPGETGPADTRLERDDKALRSYARDKETESAVGGTAPPDAQRKRETTKASKGPAEIRMLVQQVGGVVETARHRDSSSQPESLTVRIPTASLSRFLDDLLRIGRLRGPVEPGADVSENATILVEITLE